MNIFATVHLHESVKFHPKIKRNKNKFIKKIKPGFALLNYFHNNFHFSLILIIVMHCFTVIHRESSHLIKKKQHQLKALK